MPVINGELNEKYFTDIFQKEDWYMEIKDFLREYIYERPKPESEQFKTTKNQFVELVVRSLRNKTIHLGKDNIGFDSYRKPIDSIIIHHSSWESTASIEKMDAFQLLNVYTKTFAMKDRPFFSFPITSEHYWNDHMTFLSYHYIIMPDGSFINPLKDEYVGWHAGNWEVNCRSIGICFHDELEEKAPTKEALQTAKNIISKYPNIEILGHKEIKETSCPGELFLGENGWKNILI